MAIYHLSLKSVNKANGGNAVASAAYRLRMDLTDSITGEKFRYGKMDDHRESHIIYPKDLSEKTRDKLNPARIWSLAEQANTRKNGTSAREIDVALPKELNNEQQRELVMEFTRENLVRKGMIAQVSIHEGKGENPHAHLLLSTRKFDQDKMSFEKSPVREWGKKDSLKSWRENWATKTNEHLERHGYRQKIDHRTLKEQGVNREPQIHEGPKVRAMENKGIVTEKGTWNMNIKIEQLKKEIAIEESRQQNYSNDYDVDNDIDDGWDW